MKSDDQRSTEFNNNGFHHGNRLQTILELAYLVGGFVATNG
jgi:hypothetical protein